jgi:hypothetical protein
MADHTGYDFSAEADQVLIYPTLVRNIVQVQLPRAPDSDCVIEVYSSDGRMHISRIARESFVELDLSSLRSGTYLIRVETENGPQTAWIMKLRP